MTLNYNNNSVNNVKFNGDDAEILQFNGATVWERYTPQVVLFESSTPGNYSLTLSKSTACSVVVGGGAAGTSFSFTQKYGGGSGTCVYGTTTLPAGTYNISVGGGSVYNGYGKGGNYDQNDDPGYIKIETL